MQTKHLCVLITSELRVKLVRRETGLSPPVKYFLLTVPRRRFFCWSFMLFMSFFLLCFRARLFIDALW